MNIPAKRCALLLALTFPVVAAAQVATGTPAFGSFGGGPFDIVNLGNLNVHFSIPIIDKAGRGMPFTYNLAYDSSVWYPSTVSGVETWTPVQNFGWTGQTAVVTGYITYQESTSSRRIPYEGLWVTCSTTTYANFVYTDTLGIRHPFIGATINTSQQPPECNPPASQPSFTALATDGSAYSISVTNFDESSITSKTGEQFSAPSLQMGGGGVAMDNNGNEISTNGNGVFTDTLGTTALTIAGNAPNPQTFSYTNPQGTQSAYTMNYQAYTVATDFQISGVGEYGPESVSLVSSIQLPDGSEYSFTYEETPAAANCTPLSGTFSGYCVTGRIGSVTLPTGGTITYSYTGGSNGTGIYADGSTGTLTRTLNPGGQWTYARVLHSGTPGPGSTWTTTVTDPAANKTVSQFTEDGSAYSANLYETERQVYEGSSTLLQTRIDCYNGNYASCEYAAVSAPITQTDVYSKLPNGVASLSEMEYNGAQSGSGLLSQDTEYDYGVNLGAAPTTTPLEQTTISYAGVTGVIGLPSEQKVTSWTGGQSSTISDTLYYYDGASVTATSGTPQHVAGVSIGNLTEIVTHTSSANFLQQSFTYYDTGEPKTTTDTNGAVTTYTYGSGSSCGNSFATSVSEPLNLSRSMTWNCNGGVETSVIDENSQTTTATYNDPNFWRPTAGQDQENNQTTISYAGENAAEATLSFNGGNSVSDQRATLDGFGRPVLSQRLQAPGSATYDTWETDYNNTNQADRATMPFSASAGGTNSSAPGLGATYDALGRALSVTDADGGATTYTYTNNDVLIKSSGGKTFSRQLEYDGLGRITSVCEISTTLPGVGTCAQTTSKTGYWTKYTYDGLGHLLTVTQNAQATSGQQSRSYAYDWAGRLTSESNPETGTTTYTYDSACGSYAASPGDMTKRVDNANNTTCYAYDALHRVTDAGDNGAVCRHFRYDNSPTPYHNGVPPSGVTVANTMTRLEEASTDACSYTTLQTDEWFSYSPRGELTDVYESTPHSGQYYHSTVSYWPSGALETLSGIPSVPTLNYGAADGSGLDGEGRYTEVTANSGANPVTGVTYSTSSTTNPLGALTGVTYGSSDSDGFSYDPNTGRPTQYVYSVNGATDTGTLTWNANGTLGKLVIADHISGTSDSQTCTFTYDDLARIGGQDSSGYSVDCGSSWQQLFSYDAFGNVTKTGNLSFQPTYSPSTNQFSLSGANVQYDGDGNLLTDNLNSYTWDPNWGTMSSVNTGSMTVTATYDALGRVVEQYNGSTYTQILYSPIGKAALMNGSTLVKAFASLPGGGTAVYTSSGLSYYRHADWLGSSRLTSTQSRGLYSSTAYAPFGEQYAASGTADPSFTGQNSDTVPSLYDFWFRRLSSSQGRWISPDPAGIAAVDPANPQTWNRYAYVVNSPLSYVDPLGLQAKVYVGANGCIYESDKSWSDNVNGTGQAGFVTTVTLLWCDGSPDTTDPGAGNNVYGQQGTQGSGAGPSAPSNNPCSPSVAGRIAQGLQGTANIADAGLRGAALPLAVLGLSEAPPAAAVVGVYGSVSVFGQAFAGGSQIFEAVSGNSSGAAHQAEQIGNILSGPASGLTTLAITGGNLDAAETSANWESLYTGGAGLIDKTVPLLQRITEFGMSVMGVTDSGCH